MRKRLTYRILFVLCAMLLLTSCIYDEYDQVFEGPGLVFRVMTQSDTKVSYDGFHSYFENGDKVGCVIAEKTGSGYSFMSNTRWEFNNNVLILQADDTYIRKVEDQKRAEDGYVELAGNLEAYSFFFYYPYIEDVPGEDFPEFEDESLVRTPASDNWNSFPLFVNLEQTTKERMNASDFLWVGYTLDQKSGTSDITMSNANYPVKLEFLKKTSTIEVQSDAAITDAIIRTSESLAEGQLPILRGSSINLSSGAISCYTPVTDNDDDSDECIQYKAQRLTADQSFVPFNFGKGDKYRFLLPPQDGFNATFSFALKDKLYVARLSNLTRLEEGKLYIIYIASDDGSIIINDWIEGEYGDLEEVIPGKVVIYHMAADRFKAGHTVTISGESLDKTAYISMEGAVVSEFICNTEGTELSFEIPEEAKDGEVIIVSNTALETEAGYMTLVKPSDVILSPAALKPGATLTIKGNDLDLVKGITFGSDIYIDALYADSEIKVTVPRDAVSGTLFLNLRNGTIIEGGGLTVIQPAISVMTADRFKAGYEVTLSGENLDMVKSVVVPGAGSVAMNSHTPEMITFILPESAQDGQIILVNEMDGEIVSDKCVLTLVKPDEVQYSPSEVEAGDDLLITGKDLDLVRSITFAGCAPVEVSSTEPEIAVTIPLTAVSGIVTLNLKNDTQYAAPELTLVEPEVISISGKHKEGESLTLTGKHFNKISKVMISETEVGFTYDGNESLTFTVPENTPDGDIALVTFKGAKVKGGEYRTVVPSSLSTAPSSVKIGSSFSIVGDDLDLVTAILLPGSGELASSDWEYADGRIAIAALPETAVDGNITLMTECIDINGNAKSVDVGLNVRDSSMLYEGPSEKSGWKIHIEAEDLKDKTTVIVNYSFAGGVYSQFTIGGDWFGEWSAEDKEDTYEYTILDYDKNNGLDIVWRSGEVTIYSITVE